MTAVAPPVRGKSAADTASRARRQPMNNDEGNGVQR